MMRLLSLHLEGERSTLGKLTLLLEILPTVAAAVRRRRSRLEWRRSSDMGFTGSSLLVRCGSSGVWCTWMADCIGVRGRRRPVPGTVGCFGRAAPEVIWRGL